MDVNYQQVTNKKVYLRHRANFDDIRTLASSLSEEFLNNYRTNTPIEVLWSEIKAICRKCLNQVPNKVSVKFPQQPWINARIKRLSNKKQRLHNKVRLSGNVNDFQVYKKFKKFVQKECRKAHNYYLANTLNNHSGSKCLWSYIKSKKKIKLELHPYDTMTKFTLMTKIKQIS